MRQIVATARSFFVFAVNENTQSDFVVAMVLFDETESGGRIHISKPGNCHFFAKVGSGLPHDQQEATTFVCYG